MRSLLCSVVFLVCLSSASFVADAKEIPVDEVSIYCPLYGSGSSFYQAYISWDDHQIVINGNRDYKVSHNSFTFSNISSDNPRLLLELEASEKYTPLDFRILTKDVREDLELCVALATAGLKHTEKETRVEPEAIEIMQLICSGRLSVSTKSFRGGFALDWRYSFEGKARTVEVLYHNRQGVVTVKCASNDFTLRLIGDESPYCAELVYKKGKLTGKAMFTEDEPKRQEDYRLPPEADVVNYVKRCVNAAYETVQKGHCGEPEDVRKALTRVKAALDKAEGIGAYGTLEGYIYWSG